MYYKKKKQEENQIEYRNVEHAEDKNLQLHMPNPDQPDLSFIRDFFF